MTRTTGCSTSRWVTAGSASTPTSRSSWTTPTARSSGSTRRARTGRTASTASPPRTRSSARTAPWARSTRWACATRTASPGTSAVSTGCTSATSASTQIEGVYEIRAGDNLGWSEVEGRFVYDTTDECNLYTLPENHESWGFTYPVAAFDHNPPPGGRAPPTADTRSAAARSTAVPEPAPRQVRLRRPGRRQDLLDRGVDEMVQETGQRGDAARDAAVGHRRQPAPDDRIR